MYLVYSRYEYRYTARGNAGAVRNMSYVYVVCVEPDFCCSHPVIGTRCAPDWQVGLLIDDG